MNKKLRMQSQNIADKNYTVLSKLFPNAVTEYLAGYDAYGNPLIERAIDAAVLRTEISCGAQIFKCCGITHQACSSINSISRSVWQSSVSSSSLII